MCTIFKYQIGPSLTIVVDFADFVTILKNKIGQWLNEIGIKSVKFNFKWLLSDRGRKGGRAEEREDGREGKEGGSILGYFVMHLLLFAAVVLVARVQL